ncbi:endonuclease domain-containing protein [Actinoplanes sp. CA-051413]|uniref:endonuclease domain-containing protein n=1 Tax=Actinoplanes sp. CA-051413 TaxID=3239899 RepID=UPI003D95B74A
MLVLPPRLPNGQYAWWLIGDTGIRTFPVHATCGLHRKYRLTCAQFESLLDRSQDTCESCSKPGHLLSKWRTKGHIAGRLQIDHDHGLGAWAVRGMLCGPCNTTIGRPEKARLLSAYTAAAFYRTVLARHGVTSETPPEPPIGASVLDYAYRGWRRTVSGWEAMHKYAWNRPSHITWQELVADSGPHNLRPYPTSLTKETAR